MFGIFGFLGFVLILIILIVLIVLSFLGNVIRSIFGWGKHTPKHFYSKESTNAHTESNRSYTQDSKTATPKGKKKIFDDDEGEYVEFEEVS